MLLKLKSLPLARQPNIPEKDYLSMKNLNITLVVLLCSLGARIAILGASVGDAIAMVATCALYGFFLYLNNNKEEPINDKVKAELVELKNTVNALKVARSMGR